jgi:hypothetical protein
VFLGPTVFTAWSVQASGRVHSGRIASVTVTSEDDFFYVALSMECYDPVVELVTHGLLEPTFQVRVLAGLIDF